MEDSNTKINQPTEKELQGYNPTNRDFQRTEEDVDDISKSEKDEANKNTELANTEPNKSNIN